MRRLYTLFFRKNRVVYEFDCCLKSEKPFRLKMLTQDGREQIVAKIQAEGWAAFEYPMPIVFTACSYKFPGTVLDIGANVGYYSMLAASNKSNNIVSFEPFDTIANMLRANISVNGLEKRVEIRQIAVSDKSGKGKLFIPDDSHGLVETSASLDGEFKNDIMAEVSVSLIRLDEIVDEVENVSIIKIDVEGNEKAVLDGAREIIIRNRPLIFIEILDRADYNSYTQFLKGIEYVDLRLHPHNVIQDCSVIFDADAWNHVWIPREKLQQVKGVIDLEGLSWVENKEQAS